MKITQAKKILFLGALAAVPPISIADSLYLAGSEFSRDTSYSYIGHIASIGKNDLQNGPAYRLWLDHTRYQYEGNQVTHKANAYGLEAGLGTLFQYHALDGSVFASVVSRKTSISPADNDNKAQGNATTGKISGDFVLHINTDWQSNFGASYSPLNKAYWLRVRLAKDTGQFLVGPEIVKFGDNDYSIKQFGLAITKLKYAGLDIGLKSGIRDSGNSGNAPYVGVELSGLF